MPKSLGNKRSCFYAYVCFKTMVLASLVLLVFVSCSLGTDSDSFSAILQEADFSIRQGQLDEAFSLLAKARKTAYRSYDYIGIYKRYVQLGKDDKAENILKIALKRIPGNKELSAVYSYFLLRHNRLKESVDVSSCLKGTEYGSVNAEAVLRLLMLSSHQKGKEISSVFTDKSLRSVYEDAYKESGDSLWLKNGVVIDMMNNNRDSVLRLKPESFSTTSDAYFWAVVMYDLGRFGDAVSDLKTAQNFSAYDNSVSSVKITALLSDSYSMLSEYDKAEQERQILLKDTTAMSEKSDLIPVLLTDSAWWALKRYNYTDCRTYLTKAVNEWPDYVPALLLYGMFSYTTNQRSSEDVLTKAVRSVGLKSGDMEQSDSNPLIPVSDAIYRMDESYKRTKNPLLYVAKFDLQEKINVDINIRAREAGIYRMLEDNTTGTDLYPPIVVQYALYSLLKLSKIDAAFSIFQKYISRKYKFSENIDFWDQIVSSLSLMEPWECEYAGCFAASLRETAAALRLYEYIIWGNSSDTADISDKASWPDMMNLAMIYSSTRQYSAALSLYSKAVAHTQNSVDKAESMYRIACIQKAEGKLQDVRRSLEYCLSLDPNHAQAHQMILDLGK